MSIVAVSYCGGPTAPVTANLAINCPSDIAVTGHNGQPPTVVFDTPVAIQGAPPVRVACTPASGTAFPNGLTSVSCVATDARSRTAGCNFLVVVTPIPQLQKTTFLAFGDSITQGVLALRGQGAIQTPQFNTSVSYVEKLYPMLADRYRDQTVTLIADGFGGEIAADGATRLQREWFTFTPRPDALLLLEGTNDLTQPGASSAAIDSLVNALQRDVQYAKSNGARVFLATLVPITAPNPPSVIALVPLANAKIRALAAAENVTLVDLNAAIPDIFINSSGKGLHPTEQGYELMAEEWFKTIVATMEVTPSTLR